MFSAALQQPQWEHSMTEARRIVTWFHCTHQLRLVEFNPGTVITQQGEVGADTLWLLAGEAIAGHRRPLAASDESGGSSPTAARDIKRCGIIGEEAMHGRPYAQRVTARSRVFCAALSRDAYQAIEARLDGTKPQKLHLMSLLLTPRNERTPANLAELSQHLRVHQLFKSMPDHVREEVSVHLALISPLHHLRRQPAPQVQPPQRGTEGSSAAEAGCHRAHFRTAA